jgi:cytochrome b6-f complex iron-sulfur subunit
MDAGDASVTRRRLLTGGLLVVAGGSLSATVPVVRYLSPQSSAGSTGPVEIAEDSLGVWRANRILIAGRPGFVVRTPDAIHAVSAVCTHLGCVVRWQQGRRQFFCPCHGGRYSAEGLVLGGPPPAPLPTFGVQVAAGKIIVEST